jgi:hypothetical protein
MCSNQPFKEIGLQRVKIGPMKWAKLNWSFDKLFSAWKIGYIWWFMHGDGKCFWIFRHCAWDPYSQTSRNPSIWSKLPYFCNEILKFHIKHSHAPKCIIIMSQRFNNDILVEQGCGSIEKNYSFLISRDMVIFSKFFDFVIFGTRDPRHNGEQFKKFYRLHKPSYMPYLPCRK